MGGISKHLHCSNYINCKRITITDIRYAGNCGHELGQNNLILCKEHSGILYHWEES